MELVKDGPVFRPSWSEFKNPMAYIDKIRPQAEAAGICKIIPPQGWRPPFAVDEDTFRFRTRVQNLCKVDGMARVEREFLFEVRKFLFRQGAAMGDAPAPLVPGRAGEPNAPPEALRLYRLFQAVQAAGGGATVLLERRWHQIANEMFPALDGPAKEDMMDGLAATLEAAYRRFLLPFEVGANVEVPPGGTNTEDQASPARKRCSAPTEDASLDDLLALGVAGLARGELAVVRGMSAAAAAAASEQAGRREAGLCGSAELTHEQFETVHIPIDSAEDSPEGGGPVGGAPQSGPPAKKRRGRQPKAEVAQPKPQIERCKTVRVRRQRLCKPLGVPPPPEIVLGASFFKYYQDVDQCFLGRVVSVNEEADEYTIEYTSKRGAGPDAHSETVKSEDLVLLLASGESEQLAREALVEGICQECMRADDGENLLLCDGCNFMYHSTCLDPPLRAIPPGDWFCAVCLEPDEDGDDVDTDPGLDHEGVSAEPAAAPEPRSRMSSAPVAPLGDDGEHGAGNGVPDKMLKVLASFGFGDGDQYSIGEYRKMANKFRDQYFSKAKRGFNPNVLEALSRPGSEAAERALEREYWRLVSEAARGDTELVDLKVSYGSDLDTGLLGSGFPAQRTIEALRREAEELRGKLAAAGATGKRKFNAVGGWGARHATRLDEVKALLAEHERYCEDGWNLNKFPKLPGSLLQYVDEDITGVIVPWLYMGMFFSSFCWHTEDHYFASINYHHWGEPKTWYGVPSSGAALFERAARSLTPELFKARPDILTGIVTQYNPTELARAGVPVYNITQRKGEFVLTFPQAYHGGFNHGLNCAEAVNFATHKWIPFGEACVARYAELRKNPVISHDALLASLASFAARQDNDAARLARHIYASVDDMACRELVARKHCAQSVPDLVEIDYAQAIKDGTAAINLPADKAADGPGAGGAMSRMAAYGRERSHMSRLGRMAPGGSPGDGKSPGSIGWLVQVQCQDCKRFCSLSFVHAVFDESKALAAHQPPEEASGGASTKSDQHLGTTSVFLCLEHAARRFSRSGLEASQRRPALVELVVVWSDQRLTELCALVGRAALGLLQWRRHVWNALFPNDPCVASSPGEDLETLASGAMGDGEAPPLAKAPPGALYALRRRAADMAAGGEVVSFATLQDILARAEALGVDKNEPEVAAVAAVVGEVKAKGAAAAALLARRDKGSGSWPRLEECESALALAMAGGQTSSYPAVKTEDDGALPAATVLQVKAAFRRVQDLPAFVQLRELVEAARDWARRVEAFVNGAALTDSTSERAAALKKELDSQLRVRIEPALTQLVDLLAAAKWVESAVFLLDVKGASLKEARRVLQACKVSWHHPAKERLQNEISCSLDWAAKAEAALNAEVISTAELEKIESEADALRLKVGPLIDRVRKRLGAMRDWEVVALRHLGQAAGDSDPESPGGGGSGGGGGGQAADQCREVALVTLASDGAKLGLSRETSGPMKSIRDALDAMKEWRRRLAEGLFAIARPDEAPVTGLGQKRTASESEVTLVMLRLMSQLIFAGLKGDLAAQSATEESGVPGTALLPPPLETVGPVPMRDAAGARVFCVCRKPEVKGVFMVGCDKCDEWYHPQCLATTRENVERLGTFVCPTCVRDGRLVRPPRQPGTYCYCLQGQSGPGEVMVECETCSDWFHPLCVGISAAEAQELSKYMCPDCCSKAGRPPMVKLYCICRKPEFGTSDVDESMVHCDNCNDWFHTRCIGLSQEALSGLEGCGQKYFCHSCCSKHDVPYDAETGRSGFHAASAMHHKFALEQRSAARVTVLPAGVEVMVQKREGIAFVNELLAEADRFPARLPETRPLRSIVRASERWVASVRESKLELAATQSLWALLYQEATLPINVGIELVAKVQAELWARFVEHVWRGPSPGDVFEARMPSASRSGRASTAKALPPHVAKLNLAHLCQPLAAPAFRSAVMDLARGPGVRAHALRSLLSATLAMQTGAR